MIKRFKQDPALFKMILTIAIPLALQNLLVSLTQMMDSIMLGELGDLQLTASSLANQLFFVFTLFIFGLGGGAAVLTAQYWGKNELSPIKVIMATMMRIVAFTSVGLVVFIYLFPTQIMSFFSSDPEVIAAGVEYLHIVAPAYLFFGISNTLNTMFRSIEVVRLAVVSNAVTLVINIGLNYVFIFGHFGAPRMELQGAALATVIARLIEMLVVLVYVFFKEKKLHFVLRDFLKRDKRLSMDLRKYCTPVVINELIWSFGITLQAALFGHMSTIAVSANTIIGVVQNLATLVTFGVASATGVIVGKTIGEGKLELARQRGITMMFVSIILGIMSAVLVLLCRDLMVDFYNVLDETKVLAKQMLVLTSVVILFQSIAGISIVGVLRGGGDTKFSLYIEFFTLWMLAVPLGYIAGLALEWPVLAVYALFKSDEIAKAILCFWRLSGDKWIRVVTRDDLS